MIDPRNKEAMRQNDKYFLFPNGTPGNRRLTREELAARGIKPQYFKPDKDKGNISLGGWAKLAAKIQHDRRINALDTYRSKDKNKRRPYGSSIKGV